jgi:hypothetical protein
VRCDAAVERRDVTAAVNSPTTGDCGVSSERRCLTSATCELTSATCELTSVTCELTSATCELTSVTRDVTLIMWRVHMNRCGVTIATGDVTSERDVVTTVRRDGRATCEGVVTARRDVSPARRA